MKPLSHEKTAHFIKQSPVKDHKRFNCETVKQYYFLLPIGINKPVHSHEFAQTIAAHYDAQNPRILLEISALLNAPRFLIEKKSSGLSLTFN